MNEGSSALSGRRNKTSYYCPVCPPPPTLPLQKCKSQERDQVCLLLNRIPECSMRPGPKYVLELTFTNKIALPSQFFCSVSGIFISSVPEVGILSRPPMRKVALLPFCLMDKATESGPRKRQRRT